MSAPLVVLGDTLLDVDVHGHARRLSPDGPVPVLEDLEERARPGGAGLAALMAAAETDDVVLLTALGDDDAGAQVRAMLDGVELRTVRYDGPTPVKQRVRSGHQSLLRLDRGGSGGGYGEVDENAIAVLDEARAVLVSDYGRGIAGLDAVRRHVAALPRRVPVVWDPHPRGSAPVAGARLATPNAAEAATFGDRLGVPGDGGVLAAADRRAQALVAAWGAQAVAVTLGHDGALLSYGAGAPVVVPAPDATALDTCGAGDRFAVSATLAFACGSVTIEAVQAAVHDATEYVAAGGPAALGPHVQATSDPGAAGASVEERARAIAARGGVVVATGGCFDLLHAGHVASLRAARRLGDWLVVCVNSDDSVRRLKGPGRPLVPAADRVRVLEALECVDAVTVFDEDTPVQVLRRLRPQVWAKGGDYAGRDVPEAAVLQEWGGQAVVLPYLEGRSTTGLARTAAAGAASGEGIRR